ncbi:LytR/AlgR family response regulator transcription factor [Rudanella lutea]|uniref:LytR/AlgR family response regulator transcription factor n=1 Tax=Rudanella lutea TaxID=451374 RepID=UPI00037546CC|nr:LytTR family DNA-binding domain-containing protein [Rudanella lutea]
MNPLFICCDRQQITLNNIIWLEGDINYTRIHQQRGRLIVSAYTLKRYEELLHGFVRVRRDAIVNPVHIAEIRNDPGRPARLTIILSDGQELAVTRRRQLHVRHLLLGRSLSPAQLPVRHTALNAANSPTS